MNESDEDASLVAAGEARKAKTEQSKKTLRRFFIAPRLDDLARRLRTYFYAGLVPLSGYPDGRQLLHGTERRTHRPGVPYPGCRAF